jgi:ArsR family transcriptional regulator
MRKAKPSVGPLDEDPLEQQALVFKALAHPTRLAIVASLAGGERSVLGLWALLGFDLSTISRHLLQLKTTGVLASRRNGKQVLYRVRTPCVLTLMRCVATMIEDPTVQGVLCGSASPLIPTTPRPGSSRHRTAS